MEENKKQTFWLPYRLVTLWVNLIILWTINTIFNTTWIIEILLSIVPYLIWFTLLLRWIKRKSIWDIIALIMLSMYIMLYESFLLSNKQELLLYLFIIISIFLLMKKEIINKKYLWNMWIMFYTIFLLKSYFTSIEYISWALIILSLMSLLYYKLKKNNKFLVISFIIISISYLLTFNIFWKPCTNFSPKMVFSWVDSYYCKCEWLKFSSKSSFLWDESYSCIWKRTNCKKNWEEIECKMIK